MGAQLDGNGLSNQRGECYMCESVSYMRAVDLRSVAEQGAY